MHIPTHDLLACTWCALMLIHAWHSVGPPPRHTQPTRTRIRFACAEPSTSTTCTHSHCWQYICALCNSLFHLLVSMRRGTTSCLLTHCLFLLFPENHRGSGGSRPRNVYASCGNNKNKGVRRWHTQHHRHTYSPHTKFTCILVPTRLHTIGGLCSV